jgi:hypothetical protein
MVLNGWMKPLYVRPLSEAERQVLRQHLKSANGFTVRRAQMLLMSGEEGLKVAALLLSGWGVKGRLSAKPSTLFIERG